MPVTLVWPVVPPEPVSPVLTPSPPTATPQVSNNGAVNLNEYDILRRFLHPGIKGPNTDALLIGLATGDKIKNQIAELSFDQGFLLSASGDYLERRAAELGIKKPKDVGISDLNFRALAVTLDNEKLTYEAILQNLEIYYGALAVKASMECLSDSPYILKDKDELDILFNDNDQIKIIFDTKAFKDITNATSLEVCTFINNKLILLNSEARAYPTINTTTGNQRFVLVSGKLGLSSSVQINGGRSQTVFNFPTALFQDNGGNPYASWVITLSTTPGNLVFTSTNSINYDFNQLENGDLVYIYGTEFNASNNIGAFTVSNVQFYYSGANLIQSFEITNPTGIAATVTQANFNSLRFFKFTRNTLYNQLRKVIVAKNNGELDIIIPATAQIVSRTPSSGAYLKTSDILNISNILRVNGLVTVTTSTNHGLNVNDFIELDGIISTDTPPAINTGTPSGAYSANIATGVTNGSIQTSVSPSNTVNKIRHKALSMPNNVLIAVSGEIQQDVGGTPTVADPKATVLLVTSTSTLSDGSIQKNYSWKQQTNTLTIGTYDFGTNILNDGRGLLTGGFNGDNQISSPFSGVNTYDLISYNTGSNTLLQTSGSMTIPVAGHSQCNLSDGTAIISGGWIASAGWNLPGTQVYQFIPATNTWNGIARGSLNKPRMNHESILLNNNKVLVMGGRAPFTRVGSSEDPNDINYWTLDINGADMISGNTITIAGVDGISSKGRAGLSFLPGSPTNSHTSGGASQTALCTALLSTWTAECWVLADATGCFMSNGTAGGGSANNCLLSFGIAKFTSPNANDGKFFWRWENGSHAEVIQFSTILANTIFKTYESSHQGIWHHVALTKAVAASGSAGLYDVTLYVDGNLIQTWTDQANASGGASGLFYLAIDPTKATMTQLNTRIDEVRLSVVARSQSEVLRHYSQQNGYTLFDSMDYWTNEYKIGTCLNSCELYDSGGNTWSLTGAMTYAKTGFGVIKLPDGRIMTIGGYGYDPTQTYTAAPLNVTEIYNPNNGRWLPGPTMPVAREFPVCILLNNQIWVMGGRNNKTIDILDINTFKWKTSITSQSTAPYRSAGGLVDSSTLAVCGGAISTPATHIYSGTHNADLTSPLGSVIIPGDEYIRGGCINGVFKVTNVVNSTKFQFNTIQTSYLNGVPAQGTVTKLNAQPAPTTVPGPFIFDTKTGFPITSINSTLTTAIIANQTLTSINVASTAGFVADDYLLFNFGYSTQTGPVKIVAIVSNTQILIDPGFKFNNNLPVGSSVTLLNGRTPFQPPSNYTAGSFWLCPSPAGRIAAENELNDIVAAGININTKVVYPDSTGLGGGDQPIGGVKNNDIVEIFS